MLAHLVCLLVISDVGTNLPNDKFEIVDLTTPTNWEEMSLYYGAIEKQRKSCQKCGIPGFGTSLHLDHLGPDIESMIPATLPSDYLVSRLQVIDVTRTNFRDHPSYTLTLDVALQWPALQKDPGYQTLLLFHFGWKKDDLRQIDIRKCACKIPGLGYELAQWIVSNLSQVVGVATDTPCLESEQTREFSQRTVSNLLGKNGVYMIENVKYKKIPDSGCMALAMPLKLQNALYVPTRLTAFCPPQHMVQARKDVQVVMTVRHRLDIAQSNAARVYDVNLEDMINQ